MACYATVMGLDYDELSGDHRDGELKKKLLFDLFMAASYSCGMSIFCDSYHVSDSLIN